VGFLLTKFSVNKYVIMTDILKQKWQHWPAPTLEITTIIPEKGCVVDCAFCPQRVLESVYKDTRILTLDNFKI